MATPDRRQRPQRVELAIGGMTCASCAARIERTLNKLDGVTAAVNYATEKAQVEFAPSVSTADLIQVIDDTGYTATPPKPAAAQEDSAQEAGEDGYDEHTRSLRQRMLVSLALGRAGDRAVDDPAAAVHLLAVAGADAGRAGRGVGGLAVPPRRAGQHASRRGDDGHPDLAGRAGGVRLVGVCAVPRWRRPRGHAPRVQLDHRARRRPDRTSTSRWPAG